MVRFRVQRCIVVTLPRFPLQEAMRHFLQFREASLKKMHMLEQENASLKSQLQSQLSKSDLHQQYDGVKTVHDLERRLLDLKMSHDQQILDLQASAAIRRWRQSHTFIFTEASRHRKQPFLCAGSRSRSAKVCVNSGRGAVADS